MLGGTKRVHFVGIGGIGMSGIAELLANLGFEVSGSDVKHSAVAARLEERFGVQVHEGHRADNVGEAQVVVFSSAVKPGNPEIVEAKRRGIPVIPRAEMLAELMRLRFSIAVAGSHGKTTTTSMIAVALERAGVDPTAVIGGRLSAFGSNARLGKGEYLVAEADESDRSFLVLYPTIAVLTNIDREHMESYGSFEDLQQAFVDFGNKVPFYGTVIACSDDEAVASILPRLNRPLVTYGLEGRVRRAGPVGEEHEERRKGVHIEASEIEIGAFGGRCVVVLSDRDRRERLGELRLRTPGRHNLQNALAVVAVADRLGIDFKTVASALADFMGAERRFEQHGEADRVLVVDDYGHHPTEIAAVLAAARATLNRRLVVAFQPHRYTRTQQLMEAFGPALRDADEIVLTDIYAASEEPIAGVTIDALAEAVRRASGRAVHLARRLEDVIPEVLKLARPGDAVIMLGAGSIGTLPVQLVDALRRREGKR